MSCGVFAEHEPFDHLIMKQNKNVKRPALVKEQFRLSNNEVVRVEEHDHAPVTIKISALSAAEWLDGIEIKIQGCAPLPFSNFKPEAVNDPLVKVDAGTMERWAKILHKQGVPVLPRRLKRKAGGGQ